MPSAAAIGLPAAPSVAKMPSLGGLTPNLGQAGGKLQAALKEAALPAMPSIPKHMPSFDPTQVRDRATPKQARARARAS